MHARDVVKTFYHHGATAALDRYLGQYEQHYKLYCQQYIERVRAIIERGPVSPDTWLEPEGE